MGLGPQLAFDGTAGTYQMRDTDRKIRGIFKPIDEEAYAPNNPRGYVGDFGQTSFRNGVLSGEGVIREVASFMMDHEHFAEVPPTYFVEAMHPSFNYSGNQEVDSTNFENGTKQYKNVITSLIEPSDSEQSSESTAATGSSPKGPKVGMKYGSLQYFIRADDLASNYCSDLFSVDEVHKIAVLDLRIMNLDRNDGNILVRKVPLKKSKGSAKYEYKLYPIDHSLSIPDNLEVYSYDICWMDWEQAHVPFSTKSLAYIKKLDVLKDIKMLDTTFKFRRICLRNIRITGTLLKKGALAGLTLNQIGSILCREDDFDDDPEPSVLEKIVTKAQEMAKSIRQIKNIHMKRKLDSVEDFKAQRKRRTSLNTKSPEQMFSKISKLKGPKTDEEIGCVVNNESDIPFKSKLQGIKLGFSEFENSEPNSATEKEEKQMLEAIPDAPMAKGKSEVINSFKDASFGFKDVSKHLASLARDRAQSESGTELMFAIDKAPTPQKKFVQKQEKHSDSEQEEEKEDCEKADNEDIYGEDIKTPEDSKSHSSSDDESESEDTNKSPPIKRTMSLPRMKILENKPNLPKIKEEDETDNQDTKDSDKENSNGNDSGALSSNVHAMGTKPKPLKLDRLKSEEIEESKLKDSPYDEDFFYYFEVYLDESIKKILVASQRIEVGRNRSRSEV